METNRSRDILICINRMVATLCITRAYRNTALTVSNVNIIYQLNTPARDAKTNIGIYQLVMVESNGTRV